MNKIINPVIIAVVITVTVRHGCKLGKCNNNQLNGRSSKYSRATVLRNFGASTTDKDVYLEDITFGRDCKQY